MEEKRTNKPLENPCFECGGTGRILVQLSVSGLDSSGFSHSSGIQVAKKRTIVNNRKKAV
jgi:hypothetical protein